MTLHNGMTANEQPEIPLVRHTLTVVMETATVDFAVTDQVREDIATAVHNVFPVAQDDDCAVTLESSEPVLDFVPEPLPDIAGSNDGANWTPIYWPRDAHQEQPA